MDIQFNGEKSEFLNSYLTKYITKWEKCNIDFFTFNDIESTN